MVLQTLRLSPRCLVGNICVTFPWFRHFPANIIKFENSKKNKQTSIYVMGRQEHLDDNTSQILALCGFNRFQSTFHFWLILLTADQPAGTVQVCQLLHPKNLFGFRLQALRHRSTADKVHVTARVEGIRRSNHSSFRYSVCVCVCVCRPAHTNLN